MRKIILHDDRYITPFNEPARDLRVMNKPLWLHQRDLLAPYTTLEIDIPTGNLADAPRVGEETIVHRDNLFFDEDYITAFITEAREKQRPCRAAFSIQNKAFKEHALPLSTGFTQISDALYVCDLWYFPHGPVDDAEPLVIDFQVREIGYYHIPTYMATEQGDLVYHVPLRGLISIESWVHIHIADAIFGLFSRGARVEARLERSVLFKLSVLARALWEQKQVLSCSALVKIGKNCTIDPSAVILGPTTIGDNCVIGAGVAIDNCVIGDNVNISVGCQLQLSVVGDGCFLPFRASLYLTTLMDNTMVAQNTCLQMCVVGRNTFIGAGSTFTDYNLIPSQIRALDGDNNLANANRPVLGGCVGHNCRIGAGMVIYPARIVESDVVLFASPERRVISKNIYYEDSDHHTLRERNRHIQLYPRRGEETHEW